MSDQLNDEQRQALSEQIASVGRTELESMIWHREMALRTERAAHQATRAELDRLTLAGDDVAGAVHEYADNGNYERLIYAAELWDVARAGQEASSE